MGCCGAEAGDRHSGASGPVENLHPFYGPSQRLLAGRGSQAAGVVTMVAYLAFWAGVVGIGFKMARDRLPGPSPSDRGPRPEPDPAIGIVRERYAHGEIDRDQFLLMTADLAGPGAPARAPDRPTGEDSP